jgi:hypothetical protein
MKRIRLSPLPPESRWKPRAGLAPLEMTLVLPILVIMMALMIDFGVVGTWKIRTQVNTRYAAWRTVNARTGEYNPNPPFWPATAPLTTSAGADLPNSNQLWDSQPELLCPCVRGPQLSAPKAPNIVNVPGRLELDGFVLEGNGQLDKPLPLLRSAIPGSGRFRFNLKQDVFDNQWQFYSLGIPWNNHTRADIWWDIDHSDLARLDGQIDQSYQQLEANLHTLQSNPQKEELYPLDNDDEFTRYYGWPPPDFYPRLNGMCLSDPKELYDKVVGRRDANGQANPNSLLSRIDNLPCSMSRRFTQMYRDWICGLETCSYPGSYSGLYQRYNDLKQFMEAQRCPNPPGTLKPCSCMAIFCPCPASPEGVGH